LAGEKRVDFIPPAITLALDPFNLILPVFFEIVGHNGSVMRSIGARQGPSAKDRVGFGWLDELAVQ